MDRPDSCERCGSFELKHGVVRDAHFRPDDQTVLAVMRKAAIQAFVCLDCGSVQLTVDPEDVCYLTQAGEEYPDDESTE